MGLSVVVVINQRRTLLLTTELYSSFFRVLVKNIYDATRKFAVFAVSVLSADGEVK